MTVNRRDAPPVLVDPSGTWVHLLDEVVDRRVMLVDGTGSRAATVLREAGARVQQAAGAELTGGQVGTPGSFHAVVLAETPITDPAVAAARALLREDGVLLIVASNRHSPLAWYDAVRHGGRRPQTSLREMRSALGRNGMPSRAEYALLRSCASPSTVLEMHHPRQAELVLAGSNTLNVGARRRIVDLLAWLVSRQAAGWLFPGLAVLSAARPLEFAPVLGRIGYLGSAEVKLLYGDPLSHVDKIYSEPSVADAEADALEQVEQAWPGLAPRLLQRRGPDRNRISWTSGSTLSLDRLTSAEGDRWVLRAAAVLGELHRRLGSSEHGPALVHGDFWLGNVLVDAVGSRIVGVIDWTDATRGDPDVDLRFLVDSWAQRSGAGTPATDRLRLAARAQYDAARSEGTARPDH